jgi:hypothetical protein
MSFTVTPLTEAQTKVAAGANLMDQAFPGWEEKLDEDTLDIGNPNNCIGTQCSGGHYGIDFLNELGIDAPGASKHGFSASSPMQYQQVKEAWVAEAQQRKDRTRMGEPSFLEFEPISQ